MTALASDDNSKDDDDDDMMIGPPISLAQHGESESAAIDQQVSHSLFIMEVNPSVLNQTSHNADNKKLDSDEDSDYDDTEVR